MFFIWAGEQLTAVTADKQPPWQTFDLVSPVGLANGGVAEGSVSLFTFIYATTSGAVLASMVAYFLAQFCDVYIFHYLKEKTKGKHLWLRNNLSTLISQLVDSFTVIAITFGALFLKGEMSLSVMLTLFFSNYAFKAIVAFLDTPLFYFFSIKLKKHLQL